MAQRWWSSTLERKWLVYWGHGPGPPGSCNSDYEEYGLLIRIDQKNFNNAKECGANLKILCKFHVRWE